ncbi:MAG: divalent metal cation transporter [Actinobacteria bacterium]|uniref:Divalent metal cation transporter n=1 Tax=Candidatus Fonsibacter lacus TaxID=2576439 RepID=A0A965GDY6_9PROT|nr:divalent metal cation transporter [Candidatus Fonsibacter lacus]
MRARTLHQPEKTHSPLLRLLGPGLITGAADDDPSGIATYSQAGAAYGFGQLWTIVMCLPLMIAVQEACARIGSATSQGLVKVTSRIYSKKVLFFVVALVVVANVINIGADFAAVGASINLLIPLPIWMLSTLFMLIVLGLEIFIGYHTYAKFLKLLALSLLSYVAVALIVTNYWLEVFKATFIPQLQWSSAYWYVIVAVLGTTISPYMFFWQSAEEVEESNYAQNHNKNQRTIKEIRDGSWFMIITAAVVLHENGVVNIGTAADAAKALEPLVQGFPHAGTVAKVLFAIGVIGMGLLGIPVLAGSVAYAVSDAFNWREGLDYKLKEAKQFYGVIIFATVAGWLITLVGIDPIKSLVFAAVINGLVAVPLIFLIARISQNKEVMGDLVGRGLSRTMLNIAFVVMLLCALMLVGTTIFS